MNINFQIRSGQENQDYYHENFVYVLIEDAARFSIIVYTVCHGYRLTTRVAYF